MNLNKNQKKNQKKKFNMYNTSYKYKKVMAASISIIIVFSLLLGVFAQFV